MMIFELIYFIADLASYLITVDIDFSHGLALVIMCLQPDPGHHRGRTVHGPEPVAGGRISIVHIHVPLNYLVIFPK